MVDSKQLGQNVYAGNKEFWDRAWNGVKTPYTQMPDLSYINDIPPALQQSSVQRVLDLGCGSGWLSIFLSRTGLEVTGVDLAKHAIELAQQWAAQEKLSAKFSVADITALPFNPGSFDAVVANSIFEHLTISLAEQVLTELKRLLVPSGRFFGCFDKVGGGPGEYYCLPDGTHVYTDKGRSGMLLRCFNDDELKELFSDGWQIQSFDTIESGSRIIWAKTT